MIDRVVFDFEYETAQRTQVTLAHAIDLANRLPQPEQLKRAFMGRSLRHRLRSALLAASTAANAHQDKVTDAYLLEIAVTLGEVGRASRRRLVRYRYEKGRRDFDTARMAILCSDNLQSEYLVIARSIADSIEAQAPGQLSRLRSLAVAVGVSL